MPQSNSRIENDGGPLDRLFKRMEERKKQRESINLSFEAVFSDQKDEQSEWKMGGRSA